MISSTSQKTAETATTAAAPVRIAFCITDLDVGGAERALAELVTRLDRAKFEPSVVSLQSLPPDTARSLVPALLNAGVPVRSLDVRGARNAPGALRKLAKIWRAERPRIVQTFLYHANLLGRIAAWRAGVPHVVAGVRVAERRGRWRLRFDRWTDRLVDRHVCVSRAVAEFSHNVGGLPQDKLVVIPNSIDMARFASARPIAASELRLPPNRRWVTYIGRLDPQKNLEWLIAQSQRWLPRAPGHDLLIVGDGPLRENLERLARHSQIAGRVHLVGWRAEIPNILAASDALVLPSLWEGMPNVVLEAMASGRPVLATDVEGVRELLGEDGTPQLVTPGDAAEWTTKLLALLNDLPLAAQTGARNRLRAERQFSPAAMVKAYTDLYLGLVRKQ
ncbi:MAG TPA: glycosyltransferase [Pirellulales bacterium]